MITEQHQQHWLRDLGLLTQPRSEKPETGGNTNGYTKTTRDAYCRLTREQTQKLIEYVTPHAQRYLMFAEKIYDETPKELLTDPNGNVMKWLTFRKLVEDIRRGKDKNVGQKKYTLIRMLNAGHSIDQIIEKHPHISKKYAQEIIRQIKKAREDNVNQ
jgi:uncharacterized protein (DUF433 family)